MAENADPYVIEKSKRKLGQMEAILGRTRPSLRWWTIYWTTTKITGPICSRARP